MKKLISLLLTLSIFACGLTVNSFAGDSASAAIVSTAGGNLNVRSAPNASAAIVTSIKNASYVTVLGKSGSYVRVEYSFGEYGYCHSDYIKSLEAKQMSVNITSGKLNVRSGGSKSYSIIDSLKKGDEVFVLSMAQSWSKILYSGNKTGFVSSDYLSEKSEAITLAVPSYKQTDKRWANVKIASSGKTIAQIGCATTAIAMMESYRLGKTIYPDAMSKELSYSSSGNVYWPSNYTAITSSSGYLAKIYSLLKENKPVLLGAKTNSGSQHWVVVTGCKSGENLSPDSFSINDPGSSKRVTLRQFLNDYPNFYKMFYY